MATPPQDIPRMLAITPPTGEVDVRVVDRWREAGALPRMAVLLRSPGARPLASVTGRLHALLRAVQSQGVPALVSTAQADVAEAVEVCRDLGLAGIQLKGDPSPQNIVSARSMLYQQEKLWVGCSQHGRPAPALEHPASYVCAAPVFTPTTQQLGRTKHAAGLAMLRAWVEVAPRVLALGGVNYKTASQCLSAGAWGLAGIDAFFGRQATVANLARLVVAVETSITSRRQR